MNYRTATKQQLLAERARLTAAYRKAEQRLQSGQASGTLGRGASRRSSAAGPKNEVDQLSEQLAQVEAELRRRDGAAQSAPAATSESAQPSESASSSGDGPDVVAGDAAGKPEAS